MFLLNCGEKALSTQGPEQPYYDAGKIRLQEVVFHGCVTSTARTAGRQNVKSPQAQLSSYHHSSEVRWWHQRLNSVAAETQNWILN